MASSARPSSSSNSVAPPAEDELATAYKKISTRLTKKRTATVLRAFYADDRVRRMFRQLAFEMHLVDHVDEARQRVAVMFFEKWLAHLVLHKNPPENVYRLVYALAHNVFRSLRKESMSADQRAESLEQIEDEVKAGRASLAIPDNEDLIDKTEARIDMERAQAEIARRTRLLSEVSAVSVADRSASQRLVPLVTIGEPVKIVPRRRTKVPTTECAKELIAIKKDLGITNLQFAEKLGLGLPTFASYIYSRVLTVPDSVMAAARDIRASASKSHLKNLQWLEVTPMSKIIRSWCKTLGISHMEDAERDQRIAKVLGCDPITAWRWRTDGAKPKPGVLLEYHGLILASAGRTK